MNCPDCANPLEEDAQFCPKCFARIEPPTFLQKLVGFFQGKAPPRRSVIKLKKTVTIKTTDKDGQRHEYHSLDEVPAELRSQIEKLESEGLKEGLSSSSGLTSKIIGKKSISVFKVKDASGNEHTYHSLDELPPEIRAVWERAQNRTKE
jgi:hypothetical protein